METLFLILIFGLVFSSVAILSRYLVPVGAERAKVYHERRVTESARTIDALFLPVPSKKRLALLHLFTPLVLGGVTYIFVQNWIVVAAASLLGLILPTAILKLRDARRKRMFNDQLIDGLMILSSSLRGGLSMLQAIEVLVEEMPAPIAEEFGLTLREHKMGVTLEDAMEHLNKRMHSHRFNLVMTAILVARETGGNIVEVFGRLAESMREIDKLEDKVRTLTLQGKLQGLIMSLLPIVFGVVVYTSNPEFLLQMFENPMGRMLLGIAVVLEIIGSFLVIKLSQVDV